MRYPYYDVFIAFVIRRSNPFDDRNKPVTCDLNIVYFGVINSGNWSLCMGLGQFIKTLGFSLATLGIIVGIVRIWPDRNGGITKERMEEIFKNSKFKSADEKVTGVYFFEYFEKFLKDGLNHYMIYGLFRNQIDYERINIVQAIFGRVREIIFEDEITDKKVDDVLKIDDIIKVADDKFKDGFNPIMSRDLENAAKLTIYTIIKVPANYTQNTFRNEFGKTVKDNEGLESHFNEKFDGETDGPSVTVTGNGNTSDITLKIYEVMYLKVTRIIGLLFSKISLNPVPGSNDKND